MTAILHSKGKLEHRDQHLTLYNKAVVTLQFTAVYQWLCNAPQCNEVHAMNTAIEI